MSLLQNLLQGFDNAAGAPEAARAIQGVKDDRSATQHEELEGRSKMIWDDVKRLQDRRSNLDPQSPTYKQDVGQIDKSLQQHQQAFVDLYHPEKNPGALAKLGGFLRSHLGKNVQAPSDADIGGTNPNIPKTPGEAKQSMAQLQASAAGPGQTRTNPLQQKVSDLEGIGVPNDQAVQLASGQKGGRPTWKPFKVGNQVRYYDLNNPDSIPPDATAIAGGAAAPPKVGSLGEFLTQEYGPNPTAEQILKGKQLWAQSSTGTTVGTHMITVPQPDGSIKVYQVETSSRKEFPGAQSPDVPKTPGEARKKAAAVGPSSASVKPGDTLGGRLTAPQSKAKTEYGEAVSLDTIAKDVESKPDDAFNQKRLAVALEKASAGRFTQNALDYIKQTGWGNTIEEWANRPGTGALPKDLMRQIVDGAHQVRKGRLQELAAAFGGKLKMQAPTGETMDVPADQIEHYEQLGAKVAQ